MDRSQIKQIVIFTHLKLCFAVARHNLKWVKNKKLGRIRVDMEWFKVNFWAIFYAVFILMAH